MSRRRNQLSGFQAQLRSAINNSRDGASVFIDLKLAEGLIEVILQAEAQLVVIEQLDRTEDAGEVKTSK